MKKKYGKNKLPKAGVGLDTNNLTNNPVTPYTPLTSAGGVLVDMAGNAIQNGAYNSTGVNNNQYIIGSALQDAGKYGASGAALGTAILPGIGTAVGAGIGFVGGAIAGGIRGKKRAKQIDEQVAAQKAAEEAAAIENQKQLDNFNLNQQKLYNTAAIQANSDLINSTGSIMANGGKIHIKPSHKGRFTAYLKRTGSTLEEALHSKNPHVRQMANFARNAKKWHHGAAYGGQIGREEDYYGLDESNQVEPAEGEGTQLASDMQLLDGERHEDGGTELVDKQTKKPIVEAEKGEVVKGTKIYSDRLGIHGNTYAEYAEQLGKLKAKYEKAYKGASNFRERNAAERNLQGIDNKLKMIYNHQEMSKNLGQEHNIKVGYKAPYGGDLTDLVSTAAPLIDNAYNMYAINQLDKTELPAPIKRTYGNLTAMPLKTTYNVDNNIAANNAALKNISKQLYDNSASSQVARASQIGALASTLQNQNDIYQNKENVETQLVNNAALNNQGVYNQNVLNKQQIDNENAALTDQYNQDKYLKKYATMRDKSQNLADLSYGLGNIGAAYGKRSSDENRVWLDIQRDKSGSSIDNYIGTESFDRMMSKKQNRKQARELIKSNPPVLNKFNSYYGND